MTSPRKVSCIIAVVVFLMSAALASAQGGGPNIKAVDKNGVPAQLNVIFRTGPKGTQTAPPVTPDSTTGVVGIPPGLLGPSKPHTEMDVWQCPDGTIYVVVKGEPDPCPDHRGRKLGGFWWDTGGTVTITKDVGVTVQGGTSNYTNPGQRNGTGSPEWWAQFNVGSGASFFGGGAAELACQNKVTGATCTHGTTAPKFNADGALLIGNGIAAGPVFGVEYRGQINSDLTQTSGSESTSESESLRITSIFLGGRLSVPVGMTPVRFFVDGGETIDTLHFHEDFGTSSFTDNTTTTAPFVGVGATYRFWKCAGATIMYRYVPIRLGGSSGSGSSSSQFNLHDSDLTGNITFFIGHPR